MAAHQLAALVVAERVPVVGALALLGHRVEAEQRLRRQPRVQRARSCIAMRSSLALARACTPRARSSTRGRARGTGSRRTAERCARAGRGQRCEPSPGRGRSASGRGRRGRPSGARPASPGRAPRRVNSPRAPRRLVEVDRASRGRRRPGSSRCRTPQPSLARQGGSRHATVTSSRQVDVLDRVQQLDALGERPLERLAARDQARAAGALVDHGGSHGVGEVVRARRAARVDEPGAAHVAVGDLVAGQVDRVSASSARSRRACRSCRIRGRGSRRRRLGQLLLDDVGLDRDAEVVGLPGQVGGEVVVAAVLLEGASCAGSTRAPSPCRARARPRRPARPPTIWRFDSAEPK